MNGSRSPDLAADPRDPLVVQVPSTAPSASGTWTWNSTHWASTAAAGAAPVYGEGHADDRQREQGQVRHAGDLLGTWNTTAFTTHYQGSEGRVTSAAARGALRGLQWTSTAARSCSRVAGTSIEAAPATRASRRARSASSSSTGRRSTRRPRRSSRAECVHPVLGGTGAFAGVKGIIHMTDSPTPSGVRTSYTGTLRYSGSTAASTSSLVTRDLAGRVAARTCGG